MITDFLKSGWQSRLAVTRMPGVDIFLSQQHSVARVVTITDIKKGWFALNLVATVTCTFSATKATGATRAKMDTRLMYFVLLIGLHKTFYFNLS